MNRIFEALAALLGSAFGVFFAVLAVLSYPLNVIALMHIWGVTWWSAMIWTCIYGFIIPIAGQIAYLVFAVMGAYYLYDAGFDWDRAAHAKFESFSIATLSDAELQRFKKNVIRPSAERSCKEDAKKRGLSFEGRLEERATKFCECYAEILIAAASKDDLVYYEKNEDYSADMKARLSITVALPF